MLRLAWKGVQAHRLRLALTGLAIVLGVAFVSGSFVFTDSIRSAFDDLFTDVNKGVDLYVRGVNAFGEDVGRVPDDVLAEGRSNRRCRSGGAIGGRFRPPHRCGRRPHRR